MPNDLKNLLVNPIRFKLRSQVRDLRPRTSDTRGHCITAYICTMLQILEKTSQILEPRQKVLISSALYFIVKLYAWKSVAHSLGHRWMCLLCLLLRPTKKERVLGFLRKKSYRELVGKPRVFIQQADLLWNCTDRANTVHNCEPLQITITSLFFYKDQTFTKNISLLLILKWWM